MQYRRKIKKNKENTNENKYKNFRKKILPFPVSELNKMQLSVRANYRKFLNVEINFGDWAYASWNEGRLAFPLKCKMLGEKKAKIKRKKNTSKEMLPIYLIPFMGSADIRIEHKFYLKKHLQLFVEYLRLKIFRLLNYRTSRNSYFAKFYFIPYILNKIG